MHRVLLALLLTILPTAVFADRKAGDACAGGLTADGRDIYATTIAKNPAPGQARTVVVMEAERLMKTKGLSMAEARAAGEAAGQCLELIQK